VVWQLVQKRVHTVVDLEESLKVTKKARIDWGNGASNLHSPTIHTIHNTLFDPVKIGKQALEFTNQFRIKNKLTALTWHQLLCDIGTKHSKDMGDGKVPFGHNGFNGRILQYQDQHKSAAENVAMNSGAQDIAKVAVEGWIDSPGHRKNLLGKESVYCGIGVYQNAKGVWYLTQLFIG